MDVSDTVSVDERQLKKGKFVWRIRTPTRTFALQAKHDVSLGEWLAAIDGALSSRSHSPKTPDQYLFLIRELQTGA